MASPRLAKYKTEGGTDGAPTIDTKDYSTSSSLSSSLAAGRRTGLSEYTTKRLEELRLRRAESAAETYADYKARSREKDVSSSTSATDYLDLKIRRTAAERVQAAPISTISLTNSVESPATTSSPKTSVPSAAFTASSTLTTTTSSTSLRETGSPREYTSSRDSSSLKESVIRGDYSRETGTRDYTTTVKEAPSSWDYKLDTKSDTSPVKKERKPGEEDEYVGFATLPEQVHRKAIKRGFDFVLMVVGEAGLGKSTLVSSLILNDLYKDRKVPPVEERVGKTVQIEKKHMEIEEKGVKLRLTIVDTPGFNDSVNAEDCWKPIENYIDEQFDQYFKDESGLNRKNIKDNRVHCCLYFIPPFGHGLRQVDIKFMRRLHEKVNIVPVIAKSDTLTPKEVKRLKEKVLDQIDEHNIKIYEFPECDSDEDEDFKQQDKELKAAIPFAVIGSNTIVEVSGKKVRGRLYPWGIVEVENPAHCDFGKLRQMLISTHMQDLKDVTRDVHYENFRARHIKDELSKSSRDRNYLAAIAKLPHLTPVEGKLKRDSSPNFEAIMDTDRLLEQKDEEIRRMQDMLMRMQQQLAANKPRPGQPIKGQVNGAVNGLGNL